MIKYDEMDNEEFAKDIARCLKDDFYLAQRTAEIVHRMAILRLATDALNEIEKEMGKLSSIERTMKKHRENIQELQNIRNKFLLRTYGENVLWGEEKEK